MRYPCLVAGVVVLSVWGSFGCSGALTEQEIRHRKAAREFVELVANYTPEDFEERISRAGELLAEPAASLFGEAILGAELIAVRATSRSQRFEIAEESIVSESIADGGTVVEVSGTRQRRVGEKVSPPLAMTYQLLVRSSPAETPRIHEVGASVADGQSDVLGEEALLEKLNQASAAAQEERDTFKEAVRFVQEDLHAHQQKVEKDFQQLTESLDRLGNKVKQLGADVRSMKDRPRGGAQRVGRSRPAVEKAATPSAEGDTPATPTVEPVRD
ncbi:MAG: hypothetical protein KDD69_01045 [Bdellovibrionales bacterium]|nr:hypothetical protein [Bdellovibrionales bacterium]